jgi:hypothetical protein
MIGIAAVLSAFGAEVPEIDKIIAACVVVDRLKFIGPGVTLADE